MKDDRYLLKGDELTPPVDVDRTIHILTGKVMTYLPSIVLTLLMLAISAVSTLYQFDFSVKDVVWSALFVSLLLRMTLIFCAKWVGADLRYQKTIYHPIVTKPKDEYIALQEGVNLADFDDWINSENLAKKIERYLREKRREIDALKRKMSLLSYKNEVRNTKRRTHKLSVLTELVKQLEAECRDSYIQDNISHIRVKYVVMRTPDFISQSELSSVNEVYSMSEAAENGKEIAKGLPSAVFFALLGALISFDTYIGNIQFISILIDLFTITMSFATGWLFVATKTINTLVQVYINRAKVLSRYHRFLSEKERH